MCAKRKNARSALPVFRTTFHGGLFEDLNGGCRHLSVSRGLLSFSFQCRARHKKPPISERLLFAYVSLLFHFFLRFDCSAFLAPWQSLKCVMPTICCPLYFVFVLCFIMQFYFSLFHALNEWFISHAQLSDKGTHKIENAPHFNGRPTFCLLFLLLPSVGHTVGH